MLIIKKFSMKQREFIDALEVYHEPAHFFEAMKHDKWNKNFKL